MVKDFLKGLLGYVLLVGIAMLAVYPSFDFLSFIGTYAVASHKVLIIANISFIAISLVLLLFSGLLIYSSYALNLIKDDLKESKDKKDLEELDNIKEKINLLFKKEGKKSLTMPSIIFPIGIIIFAFSNYYLLSICAILISIAGILIKKYSKDIKESIEYIEENSKTTGKVK